MDVKIYFQVQVWEGLKGWVCALETFDLDFAAEQATFRYRFKRQEVRIVRFESLPIIHYHVQ